jgi:uncharacterized membrane protein YqiK
MSVTSASSVGVVVVGVVIVGVVIVGVVIVGVVVVGAVVVGAVVVGTAGDGQPEIPRSKPNTTSTLKQTNIDLFFMISPSF